MGNSCIKPSFDPPNAKRSVPFLTSIASIENIDEELWIQYVEQTSGVPYYHNLTTFETSWEAPENFLVHPSVIDWIQDASPQEASRRATLVLGRRVSRSPGSSRNHRRVRSEAFNNADAKGYERRFSVLSEMRPPAPTENPPNGIIGVKEDHTPSKPQRRFIVACAVEEEAGHMRKQMKDVKDMPLGGCRRRSRGKIGGHTVDLILTDIGEINAARVLTAAILEEGASMVRGVVNVGCSGAHAKKLDVGDVIIGTSVVPAGAFRVKHDGSLDFKGFQTIVGAKNARSISSHPPFVKAAQRIAETIKFPSWPKSSKAPRVFSGNVASADIWLQSKSSIDAVQQEFGTLCEEMEAAAIGSVCASFGIPFLLIKDISNNELHAERNNSGGNSEKKGEESVTSSSCTGTSGNGAGLNLDEIGRRAALLAVAAIPILGAVCGDK
mmetsp:Transcript_13773/g.21994  ORF Transcript_13773/g.21994 Transcript_13773/m.21994 type:complete len:439 (-) Transcript_13773:368-1684(-)